MPKCNVKIKESLEELKQSTLKSCWKICDPYCLKNRRIKESVKVQTLPEIANRIGKDGLERVESSDIEALFESIDEDLAKTN